jgi:predicted nucleic acid binding AN1-type Zn finger protein
MGKCELCGKEADLPFQCSFCQKSFCIEHRLPENHQCPKAPQRTPLGPWKAKQVPETKIEVPILSLEGKKGTERPHKNIGMSREH